VAGALGCAVEGRHLRFEPGPAATAAADRIRHDQDLRAPVVAIAPGGGTNPGMDLPEKRWPAEHFAALADHLYQDYGASILVLGGPADRPICIAMRAAMRAPSLDLCGPAPFAERGALLRRCDLYIGNDSGPTHLAVAVDCPVIAIFGPTDVGLYGPYRARASAVHRALPCSPCFVHGRFPPCPNHHACMRGLAVADVLAACREFLSP
jgi:heptosyltransferase-2